MSTITLRKILLYKYLYILILSIVIITSLPRLFINKAIYEEGQIKEDFIIQKITISNLKLTLTLTNKETLIGTYYFKTKEDKQSFEKNYKLGDKIKVLGEIYLPKENTTKNLFNYRKYLSTKNIYHLLKINQYKKVSNNKNIFYFIKQTILDHFKKNPYLNILLIGDNSYIKKEISKSYQNNGLSHLFSVSGMHVSLIASIISKLLSKLNENKKALIISIFLLLYLQIVGLQAAVIRGVLFYILIQINKVFNLNIKLINLFILTLSITLLINPKFIYDLGFQYSFSISFVLIYLSDILNGKYSLLKVSLISFIVSIPISLYNFHELNFTSIIFNLFFVPFIVKIIFPLTTIVSIFTFLIPLYNILTNLMEKFSLLCTKVSILKFTFMHLQIYFYIIYIIIIILIIINLKKKKYYPIYLLILILFIHYLIPSFQNKKYLYMLDIGQGDSIILHINKETILIDTGGNISSETSTIVENTTIPTLKNLGIKKINYLILTHGDYDHMGESINLVENFKIENVIFNTGKFNYLEQELIKKLNKKKIPYYQNIEEISLKETTLYFLNTKLYDNENDNSSLIYTKINNINILLTGDAGVDVEEELMNKYNLSIDILKVGHHGSKTSSSKEFINYINPKISLISVGEDNKFNHPNEEVLNNLKNTIIYRTDKNGSVMINLNKNIML